MSEILALNTKDNKMKFALSGCPNCGKTTLFNRLTGKNQHVGNFPGVTVEKKEGSIKSRKNISVTDLPGIYSLSAISAEEEVTLNYLTSERLDGIINIVDTTNLERSLYLTLQLSELGIPMVIALNMMDEVRKNGFEIDIAKLSKRLGAPVVPISASKNEGMAELIEAAQRAAKEKAAPRLWNTARGQRGEGSLGKEERQTTARYKYIEGICADTVKKPERTGELIRSVKIDKILTHRIFAIPIFICIMLLVFYLTFGVIGKALSGVLSLFIGGITSFADTFLSSLGIKPWLHSLVIDGIFSGVGSVLECLPVIVTLFFFLSILEDSGYMARIAFIFDNLLKKIGLSGKSFVPMILGFGCSVPAIMSTRTLASDRDRKITIMLTPFMSCSAKVPIYAMLCAAFFEKHQVLVMISLYILGIFAAVLVGIFLNKTMFKGKNAPFIMELPPYRMPSPKTVFMHMWDKAKDFFIKAFTIVFTGTVIIWALQSFDFSLNMAEDSSQSILAGVGRVIAPVFKPLGFGSWQAVAAIISGITAKEAVVSTMSVLVGEGRALYEVFTPLSAFSFLVFILLYTPCVAAVAAVKREMRSGKAAALIMAAQTAVAWAAAFAVYNIGALLGF